MEVIGDSQKRDKIAKWLMIGGGAVAAFLIAPIIVQIIGGLIGAIVALAIGFLAIQFAPWFSMKVANLVVKGIVAEAKKNPIETMTNLLIVKRQAFKEFKEKVTIAQTAERNFADKVRTYKMQYPARAAEFEGNLQKMHQLVEIKKRALQDADLAIRNGEAKLQEMRDYWDMAMAAQAANAAADMDTGDLYEKLKADTACDSVFNAMNTAFAQVDIAAALETPAGVPNIGSTNTNPQLDYNPSETVSVNVRAGQKVSTK